jgi:hypothetical protein
MDLGMRDSLVRYSHLHDAGAFEGTSHSGLRKCISLVLRDGDLLP